MVTDEITNEAMGKYKKQVKDLKAITQPLYMGKPIHKLEV